MKYDDTNTVIDRTGRAFTMTDDDLECIEQAAVTAIADRLEELCESGQIRKRAMNWRVAAMRWVQGDIIGRVDIDNEDVQFEIAAVHATSGNPLVQCVGIDLQNGCTG